MAGTSCYSITAIPFSPEVLTTPINGPVSDDMYSDTIEIGFSFCYWGDYYSQCVIGTNGVISFNMARAQQYCSWITQDTFPSDSTPSNLDNAILIPWHDLYVPAGGTIKYQTLGVAPFRRFVVEFYNITHYSCFTSGPRFTGQVILFESLNVIETHITNKAVCMSWNLGRAMHGLVNIDGSEAAIVPGRNNSAWNTVNEGIRFTPVCGCPVYISEIEQAAFRLYPNPAHNVFNVECKMQNAELKMYDMMGSEVYSTVLNTKYQTLNTNLSSGIYFVRVAAGEKVYAQKLVVE